MTSKKEVQTIRDFYQAHYDDNLRSTVSARHNYQDDLGNHFNHRVCSADFQPNLHRMQRQDSRQPENGTTLALPATVNDREVSARSSQTRPSDQVVILENMYSTTLHRSQLSINMLPQYSETCEPLLVETNDLPSESNLSPAVQIDPMEPRVETTQIIAAAIPFELTVATSESTTNDQISPLIDTASPFIDSTRSTSNEQIYENRDAISSQRHCAANTDTDHLPSYEPIISSNHNLLPTEQHLQHLMIENDPNDSPNHTEDETTNLLSITEQPCDEQRDSVTACSLAEAFNRALRHQNGEESLLLMPVASQSQSHQPGVQIKVNELIQTCPEISNG